MTEVERILEAREPFVVLEQSDWLTGEPEELEQVHGEFQARYQSLAQRLEKILGASCPGDSVQFKTIRETQAEVLELTVWEQKNQGFLWIGWGQHDRETPVFVACGWVHAADR